jgi:hypothetical protein
MSISHVFRRNIGHIHERKEEEGFSMFRGESGMSLSGIYIAIRARRYLATYLLYLTEPSTIRFSVSAGLNYRIDMGT